MLSDKQDSNLRAPHPKCGEIDLTPLLSVIVNPNGLEPLTPSLKVRCSNQLSYEVIKLCRRDSNPHVLRARFTVW